MQRLLDTPEARAQELRLWRNELDSTFTNDSATDDQKRYANELQLIKIFQQNCAKLPPALQSGLCYEDVSGASKALEESKTIALRALREGKTTVSKSYTYPVRPEKAAACISSN
jgi:hypothetical protein